MEQRHKFVQTLVDPETHRAMRIVAIDMDITIAELLKVMIASYLNNDSFQPKKKRRAKPDKNGLTRDMRRKDRIKAGIPFGSPKVLHHHIDGELVVCKDAAEHGRLEREKRADEKLRNKGPPVKTVLEELRKRFSEKIGHGVNIVVHEVDEIQKDERLDYVKVVISKVKHRID